MDKMIIDNLGNVTITNDGASILRRIETSDSISRILIELSLQQDSEIGDGTTSIIIITSELLQRAENNKLAIHCQSGFGRSGIVSLFYLLRDVYNQEYDIRKKYMGFGSSREMFNFLEDKLQEEYQKSEVFGQCSQLFSQRLFISRINYIILAIYTYTYNEITEPSFYLYLLPEEELPILYSMPDDKEVTFEESEILLHQQIFVPVLVDYEKIRRENGDRAIETLMRKNKFLLGQHERKDDE
jgi:hypothetical protein